MGKNIINKRTFKMLLSRSAKEVNFRFTKRINRELASLNFSDNLGIFHSHIFFYYLTSVDSFAVYENKNLYKVAFNMAKNLVWKVFFTDIIYDYEFIQVLKKYNIHAEDIERIKDVLYGEFMDSERYYVSYFIALKMLGRYNANLLACYESLSMIEENIITKGMKS